MESHLPFLFQGEYYNLEIDPHAQLDIDQGVILKNFCSLEVNDYAKLTIGKNVFFNAGCSIRCKESISIGDYCLFGDGVKLFDNNHHYSNYHVEALSFSTAPITIGEKCWIGANSIILKGVTIGDNVIIGAGATIYKDIPSNSIVTSSGNLTIKPRQQYEKQVTTFTASDNLEHLDYLASHLPDVAFNILAGTHISPHLNSFRRFKSLNIYSNINDLELEDEILNRTNLYLDINHWWEVKDILNRCLDKNIPILAFENTSHAPEKAVQLIDPHHPQAMVEAINTLLNTTKEET